MKTISVYTTTTNAIRDEFCVIEGIKSALAFADEVVVLDGGSTDNTIDKIKEIGDPRVKIYHNEWLSSLGTGMYAINKSLALGRCASDWCILMDSDEVFHELDAPKIRMIPDSVGDDIIAIEFNTLHFYRDYNHLLNGVKEWRDLYSHKVYMVRNGLGIHHGNNCGDPDAHLTSDGKQIPFNKIIHVNVSIFHYGHVRTQESYLRKTARLHGSFEGKELDPNELLKNFSWTPENKLTTFSGSHPGVMAKRIEIGTNDYNKIQELYR